MTNSVISWKRDLRSSKSNCHKAKRLSGRIGCRFFENIFIFLRILKNPAMAGFLMCVEACL
ncbi:hypothetical protein BET10_16075 [Pseudoalteromonas amylolytica]|uniref:Uncharacterized protein n=1 Tax=Pseudoalteromonas amylolytica TaxID=1859457 RepID=A0A1S1MV06_9GAMM|nr:hypothetical protein BFC16_16245 [Pseudoalteromonas sp. JW3]OHU89642.1 hypothetical protein BET10_16075 [Pseudoalteromonas amylolytica]